MSQTGICYANKYQTDREPGFFYTHFFPSAFPTHLSSPELPILKFRLTEVTEDIPDDAYWAWWDNEDQAFPFVYAAEGLLEMVFPYGSKAEAEQGRGKVCRVRLDLLGTFTHDEAKAADWKP